MERKFSVPVNLNVTLPAALPFDYQIIRSSRRRSISIEVRAGSVSVRAPITVAERDLHHFVREKSAWIARKIVEQKQQQRVIPQRCYETGCELPYLGRSLVLSLEYAASAKVSLWCDDDGQEHLRVNLSRRSRLAPNEQARRLVAHWYQEQALTLLTRRTHILSSAMGLRCTAVTIKATRSKWGHCTSRGAIQYNWQIILAPSGIVDYLVAHEVCHLRHPNHSPQFWELVASVCPSFYSDRAWLKSQGASLTL
jgi:predicted metal-dependent hydrolase